MTEWR